LFFFERLLSVFNPALALLLASFNGLPDAFASAGLSEETTFFAGFESEDSLTDGLGVFVFLPWAGVRLSVVESAGVLDFLALTGAASSSVAVVQCQMKITASFRIIFIPLRFLAGAPEASAATFLTFFTFSASRSSTEARRVSIFSARR
jgi:hypothetical protein